MEKPSIALCYELNDEPYGVRFCEIEDLLKTIREINKGGWHITETYYVDRYGNRINDWR